jgi:electron transfer flavoprotein beta subunit
MKAKKVPVEERGLAGTPAGPARMRWSLPPAAPSDVQVLGKGPDAAPAVVDLLEQLGVLTR